MKTLVTGGLGFLGSHLVDRLTAEGHQVTIVDNTSSNVVPLDFYRGRCHVIVRDVVEFDPPEPYDQIYHCASIVGPAGVLPHAGHLGYRIVQDTVKVLDLSLSMRASLLFVSTSEVYGHDGTFAEDVPMHVPAKISARLEYAAGKLLGEIMAINLSKTTPLHVNIVRPFNIVGPRQSSRGGFVLPRFFEAALTGQDITVFGDGTQVRSFTHVCDIVDAMMTVMNSGVQGQVFNAGNPANKVNINTLACLVKEITGSSSRIIHVDPKTIYGPLYEEAFDKIPDIGKLQHMLNWQPRIGLMETLEDIATFFRKAVSIQPQVFSDTSSFE